MEEKARTVITAVLPSEKSQVAPGSSFPVGQRMFWILLNWGSVEMDRLGHSGEERERGVRSGAGREWNVWVVCAVDDSIASEGGNERTHEKKARSGRVGPGGGCSVQDQGIVVLLAFPMIAGVLDAGTSEFPTTTSRRWYRVRQTHWDSHLRLQDCSQDNQSGTLAVHGFHPVNQGKGHVLRAAVG
jgi:hypothetical protein